MNDLYLSIRQHRDLIIELTKRELLVGQTSHLLGKVWVVLNPTITLGVYFFLFTYVFPTRVGEANTTPEVFLLAGLIQWVVLADLLVRSCYIIRNHVNLVKQTDFPVEILVLKTIIAGFIVQLIMTVGLFVIMLAKGDLSLASILLWMVAFTAQFMFSLGLAFFLAGLTPFMTDLAELAGVVTRIGLFVAPILYTAERFGPFWGSFFYANPFSYFAWVHQQALFNQSVADPFAWIGAIVLAAISMIAGLTVFRNLSPAFNDVI